MTFVCDCGNGKNSLSRQATYLCKVSSMIEERDAIKYDRIMLQSILVRKADTCEEVRDNCIEYADNQEAFALQV